MKAIKTRPETAPNQEDMMHRKRNRTWGHAGGEASLPSAPRTHVTTSTYVYTSSQKTSPTRMHACSGRQKLDCYLSQSPPGARTKRKAPPWQGRSRMVVQAATAFVSEITVPDIPPATPSGLGHRRACRPPPLVPPPDAPLMPADISLIPAFSSVCWPLRLQQPVTLSPRPPPPPPPALSAAPAVERGSLGAQGVSGPSMKGSERLLCGASLRRRGRGPPARHHEKIWK